MKIKEHRGEIRTRLFDNLAYHALCFPMSGELFVLATEPCVNI